jgi:hypothetical protein
MIEYNPEFAPHDTDAAPFRADDRRFRWVENPSDGLRFVGKAHELRGSGDGNLPYFDRSLVDHHGWYMDSHQDNTVWGEVYQLPSRKGEPVYVPAMSTRDDEQYNNHGAILDFHSTTADLISAIRSADQMAERFAEEEREYQARDSAKCRIADNLESIATAYADFKALCKEVRANCDAVKELTHIRQLIHAEFRRVKRGIAKLRRENAKLADNFWSIVPEF